MADPTWDELAKNQTDPTLITEYIDQAIAAHEADPEAHLGEGESLEMHRKNEVIDHPASSVVPDKLRTYLYANALVQNGFFVDLSSSNSSNSGIFNSSLTIRSLDDENLAYFYSPLQDIPVDWDVDNIFFETLAGASVSPGSSVIWKLGFGSYDIYDFLGQFSSWPGIGFYFNGNDSTIHAYYIDSSGNLVDHEISSFSAFSFYKLRVELLNGALYYYLHDVLVWTVLSPTFASEPKNTLNLFLGSDYRFDGGPLGLILTIRYVSFSFPFSS